MAKKETPKTGQKKTSAITLLIGRRTKVEETAHPKTGQKNTPPLFLQEKEEQKAGTQYTPKKTFPATTLAKERDTKGKNRHAQKEE